MRALRIRLRHVYAYAAVLWCIVALSGCSLGRFKEGTYTIKPMDKEEEEAAEAVRTQAQWPFELGYTGNGKIILYNNLYLMAISDSWKGCYLYDALDLKQVGGGKVQGSTITVFQFSPDGNMVVINNGSTDKDRSKSDMYLYNIGQGKLKTISNENKFDIIDGWSDSSRYYAFVDKNGVRVVVYDTKTGEKKQARYGGNNPSKLFVSDNGDILVCANRKYILKKDGNYKDGTVDIKGEIIGFKSGNIYSLYNGSIYKYNSGKTLKAADIGKGYSLKAISRSSAVFSDGKSTVVYDMKYIFRYNIKYAGSYEDGRLFFSPDFKRCFISKSSYPSLVNDNGTASEYRDKPSLSRIYRYPWLDNDTLVSIEDTDLGLKISEFNVRYNKERILDL